MAASLKNELLGLEKEYWQALKEKDVETALKLTGDRCILTGPQGVHRFDKKTMAEMIRSGDWSLDKYELKDVEVQKLSDDVAIVGYRVHEELTVDGEPVTIEAADASTWVRENGSWVCALHTEAILGDPYGRDKA